MSYHQELTDAEYDYVVDMAGTLPNSDAELRHHLSAFHRAPTAARAPKNTTRLSVADSKHATEIKTARALAKEKGWKAMAGTTKQKWWAEAIRAKAILALPAGMQQFAGSRFDANFWIEHRSLSPSTLESLVRLAQAGRY